MSRAPIARFCIAGSHIAGLFLALTLAPACVWATPLTQDLLAAYNLVVFEDLVSSASVEGRTLVGGDLAGPSANFFTRGNQVPGTALPALSVTGSISGGPKQIQHGGDLVIGGDLWTEVNMNGGGKRYVGGFYAPQNGGPGSTVRTDVTIPRLEQVIRDLSENLNRLESNSAVINHGNRATFQVVAETSIFSIENGSAFFGSINEVDFLLGAADTIIINVGGLVIDIAENFLGGIGREVADTIIWNFVEAQNISFSAEFFGAVLAPHAGIVNTSPIHGTVLVQSLYQGADVRMSAFSGVIPAFTNHTDEPHYVPEPSTLALFATGLLAIPVFLRRRRSR